MKDDLQLKLVEILSQIQAGVIKASDFAMTQLPDIAQQYIVYGRVKSIVVFMLLILFSIGMAIMARWVYKNPWNSCSYSDDPRGEESSFWLFTCCFLSPFFFCLAFLLFDYLVWFAPKVWILKELTTLVK